MITVTSVGAQNKRSKAVADFEAFFAQADKHATSAARKLTENDIVKLVRESR